VRQSEVDFEHVVEPEGAQAFVDRAAECHLGNFGDLAIRPRVAQDLGQLAHQHMRSSVCSPGIRIRGIDRASPPRRKAATFQAAPPPLTSDLTQDIGRYKTTCETFNYIFPTGSLAVAPPAAKPRHLQSVI
jgi:hypothetical protein